MLGQLALTCLFKHRYCGIFPSEADFSKFPFCATNLDLLQQVTTSVENIASILYEIRVAFLGELYIAALKN